MVTRRRRLIAGVAGVLMGQNRSPEGGGDPRRSSKWAEGDGQQWSRVAGDVSGEGWSSVGRWPVTEKRRRNRGEGEKKTGEGRAGLLGKRQKEAERLESGLDNGKLLI